MKRHVKECSAGFTLVELLVVILIVAILAGVGIPTYQAQIRESRRTDAKTAALDLAAREEKYFSLNNTYTGSPANLGYAGGSFNFAVGSGSVSYYNLYVCMGTATTSTAPTNACTASAGTTGSSYIVALSPVAGLSQALDTTCQYFAIDNTGTQFASSATGIGTDTTSTCWH